MHDNTYTRRQLLAQAAAGGVALGFGPMAFAQSEWPKQPIKLIVPYAPGGVNDVTLRLLSKQVADKLGQSIIIENRPGAGGVVGTNAVAKAAPDGYTIGVGATSTLIATPLTNPQSTVDVTKDLTFICQLAATPMLLAVNPSVPVKTAAELPAYLKAERGKLSYGSMAVGHFGHVVIKELSDTYQAAMVHSPYKGESPLMQDVLGNQLQFAFFAPSTAKPMIDSGKLKPIGVSGTKRLKSMPNLPTLAEQGWAAPIFKMNPGWVGVVAPAKTPAAIVQRLSQEYQAAIKTPEINDQIAEFGMDPVGSTSEQFLATYQAERPIWKQLLTKAGLEVRE
jgi:tripartite-type tricarboxylate transporter receptor subunit TctC